MGLDCMTDIAKRVSGTRRRDAAHQAIIGHFGQTLGFDRWLTNIEHAGCIAVPAIENDGDVDIQNVTIKKRFWPGNSVTNNMIKRNAGLFWKAFIIQRRGGGSMRQNIVMT